MARKNAQKGAKAGSSDRREGTAVEEVKTPVPPERVYGESQRSPSLGGEQAVEDAKFFMGPQKWSEAPPARELPTSYGDNCIALLIVDPWWAHSYWELTENRVQEGLRFLNASQEEAKTVLRIYDVTGLEGTDQANHSYDIELQGFASNWYIHLNSPEKSFRADIGLRTRDGRFFTLARSNTVTMPRSGMSNVVDERWMNIEFEKMYALSGGLKLGAGSLELKESLERRFREGLFSGAVSSFGASPVKKMERAFWFVLDAELIIYGATQPDAQVTVEGRPIELRPDGTFTLRYALPDGRFPIEVKARSADGKEERTITPIIQRNTEISQPVIK